MSITVSRFESSHDFDLLLGIIILHGKWKNNGESFLFLSIRADSNCIYFTDHPHTGMH